eukprot:1321063-Pyramimonas_sp.AAC.1
MSALSASMSLAAPVQLRSRRSGLVAKTVVPMQRRRVMATRMSAVSDEEIAELEKKLAAAKATRGPVSTAEPSNGEYSGASFNIQTFNAISPVGLQKFEKGKYKVAEKVADLDNQPMAIMLRSHKLQLEECEILPRPPLRQLYRLISRWGFGDLPMWRRLPPPFAASPVAVR